MTAKDIVRLWPFLILCLIALWWWRQGLTRKRFVAAVKRMAESGRNEIDSQPIECWLNRLNQETAWPLGVTDAVVLRYEGQDFFFVDGAIHYKTIRAHYGSNRVCFLVAVGQPCVELLTEQPQVFRLMTGSAELAAFSIFRWPDFVEMLEAAGGDTDMAETRKTQSEPR